MQAVILSLITAVFLAPYASTIGALKYLGYVPEVISVLVLPYVFLEGARRRYRGVDFKYWLAFGAMALVVAGGLIANGMESVPLIYGLRFYLRALPFFFVPAIYDFSEAEIRQQLYWLLCLGLLQFPLSVFQRWQVWSQGRFSGDTVQGTLLDSGAESIFLICAALILTCIYLRGYIKKQRYFLLLFLLLFPTCINETKVTAIYVPLGFTVALLVGTQGTARLRGLVGLAALLLAFAALFIPVYNLMNANSPFKSDKSIVSFFSDQKELGKYMSSNVAGVGGANKNVRRGDSITVPIKTLSQDPIHFALGLGLGSTAPPVSGVTSAGRYYRMFELFMETSFTYFFVETGALGVVIIMLMYWLIFRDAVVVSHEPGIIGALAGGWTAVTVLLCISLFYSNIHIFACLSYLFWYFSGVIAADRTRMRPGAIKPRAVWAAESARAVPIPSSASRAVPRS